MAAKRERGNFWKGLSFDDGDILYKERGRVVALINDWGADPSKEKYDAATAALATLWGKIQSFQAQQTLPKVKK